MIQRFVRTKGGLQQLVACPEWQTSQAAATRAYASSVATNRAEDATGTFADRSPAAAGRTLKETSRGSDSQSPGGASRSERAGDSRPRASKLDATKPSTGKAVGVNRAEEAARNPAATRGFASSVAANRAEKVTGIPAGSPGARALKEASGGSDSQSPGAAATGRATGAAKKAAGHSGANSGQEEAAAPKSKEPKGPRASSTPKGLEGPRASSGSKAPKGPA